MYKKRQRIYKDLTLNANDGLADSTNEDVIEHNSDHGGVNNSATHIHSEAGDERSETAGERDETLGEANPDNAPASTPTPTTIDRKEDPAYQPRSKIARMKTGKPVEIGYRKEIMDSRRQEGGIKKPRLDPDLKKLIPKGTEWLLMQDSVRMQMRQILSDNYRKTLTNIAGSTTFGDLSKQELQKGQKLLLPIASRIDKELRLTLIPGKIDHRLFDFDIPASYRRLNQEVEENYRKLANFAIKVDEREAALVPLRAEQAELEERYKSTKEEHNLRMKSDGPSRDYVQMLLLHPSSEQY